MKKFMFALCVLLFAGLSANAQACTKGKNPGCCAKKSAMAKTSDAKAQDTKVASAMTEAEIVAESDESISVRTCPTSGKKSFFQKSVCEHSGSVSWNEVSFCSESKKFTRVASASMEKEDVPAETKAAPAKKSCTKGAKSKCCAKKEKV